MSVEEVFKIKPDKFRKLEYDPIFEIYQEDEEFSNKDYYDPKYNLRMKVATMGADTPLMMEAEE